MSSQLFPDPRRIITGHNADGKSVVVADSTIPCVPTTAKCNFAVLYETHKFPDSLDEWIDPAKAATQDLSNSKGVVLRVVDIAPKTETMFHRTESLDFGILHTGQITCYLDDGLRIDMKAGDVCIQRGTIHGWTNHSDEPARIYFILTEHAPTAHPVQIGGELLTSTGYSKESVTSGGEVH